MPTPDLPANADPLDADILTEDWLQVLNFNTEPIGNQPTGPKAETIYGLATAEQFNGFKLMLRAMVGYVKGTTAITSLVSSGFVGVGGVVAADVSFGNADDLGLGDLAATDAGSTILSTADGWTNYSDTGALVGAHRYQHSVDRMHVYTAGVLRTFVDALEFSPHANDAMNNGRATLRWATTFSTVFQAGGTGAPTWRSGAGTPEGVVTAPVGSLFSRTDGAAGTSLYVKESGVGNTGWVGK